MTTNVVRLAVDLTLNQGKTADFEAIARKMIAGTANEPGTLEYDFFLSQDGSRCRLLEAYEDSDALAAHFAGPVVQELVPALLQT